MKYPSVGDVSSGISFVNSICKFAMADELPVYNTEDAIPKATLMLSVIQHLFAIAVYMTYPVIISAAVFGTADMTSNLISLTLIGCGFATLLLSSKKFGTGFPMPIIPNSSYLPASVLAAGAGGIPLLSGMLILSGVLEMIVSRFTGFFRRIFPEEVTGVVLFLLGIAITPTAFPLLLGSTNNSALDPASAFVGAVTLVSIIIFSISKKRFCKFYSTILGMAVGCAAALILGVFSLDTIAKADGLALFAIPTPAFLSGYSFDAALIAPFLIGVICIIMKTAGNLTLLSSYTRKGDRKTLSRGLFLEGAGLSLTGALGGIGVGTSSSDAGLVVSTGIASRKIGIGVGLLLILFGFMPVVSWMFCILPRPVLGAVLLYAVVFVMIGGIQSLSSRMLDTRRTFVVLLPILIGVSSGFCPYLYADLPSWAGLFFSSPLTAGSITAVLLGLLFKIGISHRKSAVLEKDAVYGFVQECGKLWTLNRLQVSVIAKDAENMADALGEVSLTLSRDRSKLEVSAGGAVKSYLLQ